MPQPPNHEDQSINRAYAFRSMRISGYDNLNELIRDTSEDLRAYAFDACASVGTDTLRARPRDPLKDHPDRKFSSLPGMFGRERLHVLATKPR